MAAGTLSRRLLDHGIDARSTRNTALLALAADLPAPVLADILGLHVDTASRWVTYAKQDWSAYVAARAQDARRKWRRSQSRAERWFCEPVNPIENRTDGEWCELRVEEDQWA
jgi:hypothetical protein